MGAGRGRNGTAAAFEIMFGTNNDVMRLPLVPWKEPRGGERLQPRRKPWVQQKWSTFRRAKETTRYRVLAA